MREKIQNLADYDQIFIGYPIWWYKMPMVMYSFFEQHDFSGKPLFLLPLMAVVVSLTLCVKSNAFNPTHNWSLKALLSQEMM